MQCLGSRLKRGHQTGAAAIEFALLFTLFFVVFYALVSYAIVMLLQQGLEHAAEEGARAAIAVDPLAYTSTSAYLSNGIQPQVKSTVATALDWLPSKAKTKVLGINNGNVTATMSGDVLTVTLTYASYASDPLLPVLTFPVIGQVPQVPTDLTGKAVITLGS